MTLFWWFVAAMGLKKQSQPDQIIFQLLIVSLLLFFEEISTHPIEVIQLLVRLRD